MSNYMIYRDGDGRQYRFLTDLEFARFGHRLCRNWIYLDEIALWRDRIRGEY